jgi:hypothetical protein
VKWNDHFWNLFVFYWKFETEHHNSSNGYNLFIFIFFFLATVKRSVMLND